jgi:hypothetical protein
MAPRQRRSRIGFALSAVLAAFALLVLGDVAGGVVLFVALIVFFAAGISALKGEDAEAVADSQRRGMGWIWF